MLIFNPVIENIKQDARLVIYDEIRKKFSHFSVIKKGEKHSLNENELDSHMRYTYKYQIKRKGKWIDEIKYKPLRVEKVSEEGLKYLFFPVDSNYLIVGFQGISRTPSYNYVRSLKDVSASRLYIKDDYGSDLDTQSSYYLGENKKFDISDKVIQLIEKTRKSLRVSKENVICVGSSKGGYAALYFSYKGKYGHAVVGGPQVLLGDYLSSGRLDEDKPNSILRPIFKHIAGEINESNKVWLNNILLDELKNSRHDPNVLIHVGKGEPHYKNHVLPFIEHSKGIELENIKINLGDYDKHEELVNHFPDLLLKEIKNKTSMNYR